LLDNAATGPVVITGALPPVGRDLDVLASPPVERAVGRYLDVAGFFNRGRTWVRFRGSDLDAVEIFTTDELHLPPGEATAVLETQRGMYQDLCPRLGAPCCRRRSYAR
jgi:hypothetical protein